MVTRLAWWKSIFETARDTVNAAKKLVEEKVVQPVAETTGTFTGQAALTAGSGPTNSVSVSSTTNQITTSGYSYDASGNMTNDGYNTMTYDAENQVTGVSNAGASATYTYDGVGQRVRKVSGSTTDYIYSGGKVIAEYDGGGAVQTEYVACCTA